MKNNDSLNKARILDERDPLKKYRQDFLIGDPDVIYLDGNSLGRLVFKTRDRISSTVEEEWGKNLIKSWNEGWYEKSSVLGARLAGIIGARPHEVIIADSTSVNLFKLAYGALLFNSNKKNIVTDGFNFPSDLYILQGLVKLFGNRHQIRTLHSKDQVVMDEAGLEDILDGDTALVSLSHVAFKSAFMYNMERVNKMAHDQGALVLWDLSHAAGAVPVQLNRTHADLAIGCTYKYLNGGPGAPAFLYVREDLQEKIESPVWGWFGDSDPFKFNPEYKPAPGIRKFLSGTPPIVSLSAIEPSLEMIREAGMEQIRSKSMALSEYLIGLFEKNLKSLGYQLGSPKDPEKRGSHISLKHPEAYRICQALIDKNILQRSVIPDFREPDNIRLGMAPLYTSFEEIFLAMNQLEEILKQKLYEKYSRARNRVT